MAGKLTLGRFPFPNIIDITEFMPLSVILKDINKH